MGDNTINATTKDTDRTVSVDYNFGKTLKESIDLFGEDVVHNNFQAQAVISLQSLLRRGIKGEKNDEEIAKMAMDWKPGMKTVTRKSAQEKIKDAFGGMTDEDRKALLKELRSSM